MIDGSKKSNRQLPFELQNSHVCEKRSKAQGEKWNANKGKNDALFKDGDPQKPPNLSLIAKDVSRNNLNREERVQTFVFADYYMLKWKKETNTTKSRS